VPADFRSELNDHEARIAVLEELSSRGDSAGNVGRRWPDRHALRNRQPRGSVDPLDRQETRWRTHSGDVAG